MVYRATNHGADAIYSALNQLDWDAGDSEVIIRKAKKGTRTLTQNAAMHKYFDLLAEALNDAGYSVQTVVTAPVSFTRETVKEYLWRRIQTAMFPEIISTTDLNKLQVSDVYENLNRVTAEKFGVSIPFPSEDMM